jgi:alpha-methylacyl-CoA racemase
VALNLKDAAGVAALLRMLDRADVLIEPFRPGVMERLGLGPEVVMRRNPRLVYARMTGFGQTGPYAPMAGHDINYIAVSGMLAALGRKGDNPLFPLNLLGDFAGGGMLCAMGILLALVERSRSGQGQVVDAAMVRLLHAPMPPTPPDPRRGQCDGAAYLGTFVFNMARTGLWSVEGRGTNMLDSGAHFYETYKTSDGKYMAVYVPYPARAAV